MAFEPVAQGGIHAGLPAWAGGAKHFQHIAKIQPFVTRISVVTQKVAVNGGGGLFMLAWSPWLRERNAIVRLGSEGGTDWTLIY